MKIITNLVCLSIMFITTGVFAQSPLKVNPIMIDSSFDALSLEKLKMATQMLDSVLNSQAFKDGVTQLDLRIGNLGLTNNEILKLILSGANWYKDSTPDFAMDLHLMVFDKYRGAGNFGVTDMNTHVTATHRCFIWQSDVRCYAAHLAHEYMHEIGFLDEKTGVWPFRRKTSAVPYQIGNLINRLLGNQTPCVAIHSTCKKE